MADFKQALALTKNNEGGYSNNKEDSGGETYKGISRNNWPNWKGWADIDEIKKEHGTDAHTINVNAAQDPVLQELVDFFYKTNFWDVNSLDKFNDQQIANSVYDFGVNSGTGRAAKVLQGVLGVTQDGQIGNGTLSALNSKDPETVYNAFNAQRKKLYEAWAQKPGQAQFLHSWLSRLTPYQA